MGKTSFRVRLFIVLFISFVIFLGSGLLFVITQGSKTVEWYLKREAALLSGEQANDLGVFFRDVESVTEEIGRTVSLAENMSKEALTLLARTALSGNDQIFRFRIVSDRVDNKMTVAGCGRASSQDPVCGVMPLVSEKLKTWLKEAEEEKEFFWREPEDVNAEPDLVLISPIIRKDSVSGIIVVDIDSVLFEDDVKRIQIGKQGYSFILAQNRLIGYSSGTISEHERNWLFALRNGEPVKARDPSTGLESWFVSMPLTGTDWRIVSVFPVSELNRTGKEAEYLLLWMAIGFVLVMGVILWVVTMTMTSPLKKVVDQAARYAAGDFSERLDEGKGPREIKILTRSFNVMGRSLEHMVEELRATQSEIIAHLGRAGEFRDTETGRHVQRVSAYAELIARNSGLSEEECYYIKLAAPMHDVGKIGVPDTILFKPGPLTPEERVIIETHAVIGRKILEGGSSLLITTACAIAATHHEKWDGTGYPAHLKGKEIPVAGRIVAIADVFDALTSDRPYKQAMDPFKAKAIIEKDSGTFFDPSLVEIFSNIFDQIIAVYTTLKDTNVESGERELSD